MLNFDWTKYVQIKNKTNPHWSYIKAHDFQPKALWTTDKSSKLSMLIQLVFGKSAQHWSPALSGRLICSLLCEIWKWVSLGVSYTYRCVINHILATDNTSKFGTGKIKSHNFCANFRGAEGLKICQKPSVIRWPCFCAINFWLLSLIVRNLHRIRAGWVAGWLAGWQAA